MPAVSRRVVAVGSHPDDVELGCGATLARHAAVGDEVTLLVMTTGQRGPQGTESRVEEQEEAARLLGARLVWGGYTDGAVPHDAATVSFVEGVLVATGADVVYVHAPDDSHQDHVATARATLGAARRVPRVLCYESPSSLGFAPALLVPVTAADLEAKLGALRAHSSQVLGSRMVEPDAVEAGARYRGFQACARYAEAFLAPRFAWDLGLSAACALEEPEERPLRLYG